MDIYISLWRLCISILIKFGCYCDYLLVDVPIIESKASVTLGVGEGTWTTYKRSRDDEKKEHFGVPKFCFPPAV